MIRSMLCALVMFLGFIIAPTSAYPTGKVVEVTEADFDAQVRPPRRRHCCPAAGDDRFPAWDLSRAPFRSITDRPPRSLSLRTRR